MWTLVILAIVAGIIFDITNGWNDSANAIATVISTRVLSPLQALALSAVLNFLGALASTKVAVTMGGGIVILPPALSSVIVVVAAMLAAAAWVTWCTRLGLPISCSHSLLGGLLGATIVVAGSGAVIWSKVGIILIVLLLSPVAGFIFSFILVVASTWLARGTTPRKGHRFFGFLQLGSASFMAFEHGLNDAQKVMGMIALALFAGGLLNDPATGQAITDIEHLYIPLWVILACAAAMAFGTAVGGWRVIRTLGTRLAKITTTEGFAAETGAGIVLQIAAGAGIPVSTTHTITGGIFGVGSAKGIRAVKWGIGTKILWAWLFTLPATVILGAMLSWFAAVTNVWAMVGLVVVITGATFMLRRRGAEEKTSEPKAAS